VFCSYLLRWIEVSTLWSSFLSFLWFVNCILGIRSFWDNINLSVSAYHECSQVAADDGKDVEKEELLHYRWDCKLLQPLWKPFWRFLRKLDIVLPEDPAIYYSWAYTQMFQHVIRTHAFYNSYSYTLKCALTLKFSVCVCVCVCVCASTYVCRLVRIQWCHKAHMEVRWHP
jgi:hypothetical protein